VDGQGPAAGLLQLVVRNLGAATLAVWEKPDVVTSIKCKSTQKVALSGVDSAFHARLLGSGGGGSL
jgi:hypothetical protein